jgi:hypothetical protein
MTTEQLGRSSIFISRTPTPSNGRGARAPCRSHRNNGYGLERSSQCKGEQGLVSGTWVARVTGPVWVWRMMLRLLVPRYNTGSCQGGRAPWMLDG